MKTFLFSVIATLLAAHASFGFGSFTGGPWANDTYYPGNLDGKYQAAVFAPNGSANISGVISFTISNGSTDKESEFDNFFTIFVAGRTYTGVTDATINYDNDTVTGALLGTSPEANPPINLASLSIPVSEVTVITEISAITGVAVSTTNTNIVTIQTSLWDLAAMVNRGLSGGFRANINSQKATFTFSGSGELSSASEFISVEAQSVTESQVVKDKDGNPETIIFSPTATGRQTTATRPFQISGIRVAF